MLRLMNYLSLRIKKNIYLYVYVCACMRVCASVYMCGGMHVCVHVYAYIHATVCLEVRGQIVGVGSSSTVWSLGIKFGSSGLVTGPLPYWAILPVPGISLFFRMLFFQTCIS